MLKVLSLTVVLGLSLSAYSEVVRPAADFTFPATVKKNASLKSLRGQAVVLLVTDSSSNKAFKKQLRYLEEIYEQFASKQVVFIAAIKNPDGTVRSNIPFLIANSQPAITAAYGIQEPFHLVIIGQDGNIDYRTDKVCTGERVRDVIQNSFTIQAAARK
ncbi:MAG: hypothetical protein JWL90_468 [Chthoniobacteraceae bacterium]|nr:hypothetical protein [Chthoniobacteraceae bacterium]MDB6172280.1 hypothetical protein [Chthoniobacteraceae bacterium]